MSTDLTTTREPAALDHLTALSTDDLRRRLSDALSRTVEELREAAAIVRELEGRGEDLSELRGGLFNYLRLIAYGQLLPELVVRFSGSPYLMKQISALPIPDQEQLASDPMVEFAEGPTVRKVDLTQAPPEVAKVVIGPDGIRSPEEQRAYLGQQKAKAMVRPTARAVSAKERRDRRLSLLLTTPEMSSLMENAAGEGLSDHEYAVRMLERAGAFKRAKG